MINQQCRAGHNRHDRIQANTALGDFIIYDWKKYMGFSGYCTGQDDVSMTMKLYGRWEKQETERITQILASGDNVNNLVLDIGCHIGWFTRLAQELDYVVVGVDGDIENAELCQINNPQVDVRHIWIDAKTPKLASLEDNIELVKIDIEGNEQCAINWLGDNLKRVKNIVMEVSPVFNDSYPALIQRLVDEGFKVYELNGAPFDFNWNFQQKDLWLQRK